MGGSEPSRLIKKRTQLLKPEAAKHLALFESQALYFSQNQFLFVRLLTACRPYTVYVQRQCSSSTQDQVHDLALSGLWHTYVMLVTCSSSD